MDLTEGEVEKKTQKHKSSILALNDPLVRRQLKKMKQHSPWFLGAVTMLQVVILGIELFVNWKNTGSVILTSPFNYLIGPDTGPLILFGARFLPCMKQNTGYDTAGVTFACPGGLLPLGSNSTCTLAQACSMPLVGFNTNNPAQWYRFIIPIFLHGGIVHLLLNLSFQVNVGFQLEREIGFLRMGLIYMIAGIGGFIFGAPLSDISSTSVGASGSLYGISLAHSKD